MKEKQSRIVLLRGGGDLASGVALRLHRVGIQVVIVELPQPRVVRRTVSFAEAVYNHRTEVEGVAAKLVAGPEEALDLLPSGEIPVLVDPQLDSLAYFQTSPLAPKMAALVDCRMMKRPPETSLDAAPLMIGLGPGFIAGVNCHAVIETNRGHHLGRVIWKGSPEADTGIPERVHRYSEERVLRAPADGELIAQAEIGDHVEKGERVATVGGMPVYAPFGGVLRGLMRPGLHVSLGEKIGDVDPRDNPAYVFQVSDKSRAIGGSVLEALLSKPELRPLLWGWEPR